MISVEDAVDILGYAGCGQDPVVFHGKEVPADALPEITPLFTTPANEVRIGYWVDGGFVKHGTLVGMVRNRLFSND